MVEHHNASDEAFKSALGEQALRQKKNELDYERFNAFQRKQRERFQSLEKDFQKENNAKNLKRWIETLSPRWRNASLRSFKNKNIAKEVFSGIKDTESPSLWVEGGAGSGKTYLTYALCRYFIASGRVTPSSVLFIKESDFVKMAQNGFKGKEEFSRLLNISPMLVIFDGIGEYGEYENSIAVMIESFIEKLYNDYITVVFASNISLPRWSEMVSENTESKLQSMVETRVFSLGGKNKKIDNNYNRNNMLGALE